MITQPKSSNQVTSGVPAKILVKPSAALGRIRPTPSATASTVVGPAAVAALLIPDGAPLPPARRLVVLIPERDADESKLAQHIYALASPRGLAVLYVGVSKDTFAEPRARRYLATLAAITRDVRVSVATQLFVGDDWMSVVPAVWQAGDLIVCHKEQKVASWRVGSRPLSQTLVEMLRAPVLVLAGFYPDRPSELPGRLPRLIGELIPFLIFVAFLGIQILIHVTTQATAYTILMSVSVLIEFGLLGLWNHLFNH